MSRKVSWGIKLFFTQIRNKIKGRLVKTQYYMLASSLPTKDAIAFNEPYWNPEVILVEPRTVNDKKYVKYTNLRQPSSYTRESKV